MRRFWIVLLVMGMGSLTMTRAQQDTVLSGVVDVEFVGWVTGPDSPNQTDVHYDVDGTDLGSMFDRNGTVYIAFGDTLCPWGPYNVMLMRARLVKAG